jgi:hypothetical protein
MLCTRPIRYSNARRQLSQRICETGQTHGAAHMAAARGRRGVRSHRPGEGCPRLSSRAVRKPSSRARGCGDAHRLVALDHIRDGSATRSALSSCVWSGHVQAGAVAINCRSHGEFYGSRGSRGVQEHRLRARAGSRRPGRRRGWWTCITAVRGQFAMSRRTPRGREQITLRRVDGYQWRDLRLWRGRARPWRIASRGEQQRLARAVDIFRLL